jgi:L-asparaginase
MPSTMLRNVRVVLGTGGTIAGTARDAMDNVGYASAQRSAADLLAGLAGGAGDRAASAQDDPDISKHGAWHLVPIWIKIQ